MANEPLDRIQQRATGNPAADAAGTLAALIDFWSLRFPEKDFLETFFKPMWADEQTSGYDQVQQLAELEAAENWGGEDPMTATDREAAIKVGVMMASCAFVVQTMKANKLSAEAWSYAIDASHWLGVLQGLMLGGGGQKRAASELGRSGANAAHAENRAMKALVHQWCDQNMPSFKSMDSAAEAIAGKLVPVKFRTAREWIGAWKKLRSAGKP